MGDFDSAPDRKPHNSIKWSYLDTHCPPGEVEVLPLWVADMDFPSPPEVVAAVRDRASHPVYGYAGQPESFFEAYRAWARRRYGVEVRRDWLVFTPGVVTGLALAVRALSEEGEGVIIQPPVYHPFAQVVRRNGRRLVENRLLLGESGYRIDFDDLESHIDPSTRAIVFCSPHNPVGRVWERPEIERLAEIVVRRDLVLVSDEIHADIVYGRHRHSTALGLPSAILERLVVFHAPSKTFNIAGLQTSIAAIPNPKIRARFQAEAGKTGLDVPSAFGMQAAEAAWRHGEAWLLELLPYLEDNLSLLRDLLASRLPRLALRETEGTFLAWIDFRRSGIEDAESPGRLHDFLLKEARIWCDEGSKFGPGGEGFVRLNFGCPRSTLTEALERLARALSSRQ